VPNVKSGKATYGKATYRVRSTTTGAV